MKDIIFKVKDNKLNVIVDSKLTNREFLSSFKDRLEKLANYIKREKSPQENCNINIYDSKDIVHLIEKYPIKGQEYVDVADHYVYMLTFDGMGWYYPLKDALYIEYGGKKPKQ